MQNKFSAVLLIAATFFSGSLLSAQSKADDIPVGDLPAAVKSVLEKYAQVLHDSKSVDAAATGIAGTRYKIWIAKNDPAKGMPAPVTIIAPASGAAKIVNVGSY